MYGFLQFYYCIRPTAEDTKKRKIKMGCVRKNGCVPEYDGGSEFIEQVCQEKLLCETEGGGEDPKNRRSREKMKVRFL